MCATSAGMKRRRERAVRCYYCDRYLTHNIPVRLDSDATIEHLNSRNAFPDGRPNRPYTIVIACRKCNESRAAEEAQGLGIDHLRALAGRWPREYGAAGSGDA